MIGLTKLAVGAGNVALSERTDASVGPGHVRLAVLAAGICGTDLHIEAGEYAALPPVTMGHEVCGEVVEAGGEQDAPWLGQRVVSETFFSTCGVCQMCCADRPNLCVARRSIGTHVDGAFAARIVVPTRNLHAVPDWLTDAAAALTEPLACVCQCLLDPTLISPGDRVLVTGPGPIGLLAGQVASALGGSVVVTGLATDEKRLDVARGMGLDVALAGDDVGSVDVAIESSGSPGGLAACLGALRPGGTHAQLGIFGRAFEIRIDPLLLKEVAFYATFASTPRAWLRALALIESRRVDLEGLVSAVVPLREWERAFQDLRSGSAIKVVFNPRDS